MTISKNDTNTTTTDLEVRNPRIFLLLLFNVLYSSQKEPHLSAF